MIEDPTLPPMDTWPKPPTTIDEVYAIAEKVVRDEIHPYVAAQLIFIYSGYNGDPVELTPFVAAASSWESTDAHLIYDKIKDRVRGEARKLLEDAPAREPENDDR